MDQQQKKRERTVDDYSGKCRSEEAMGIRDRKMTDEEVKEYGENVASRPYDTAFTRSEALRIVSEMRDIQNRKWGRKNGDWLVPPAEIMVVLMEEVGEAANAVNENQVSTFLYELIDIAATAVAAIENFVSTHQRICSDGGACGAFTLPRITFDKDQEESSLGIRKALERLTSHQRNMDEIERQMAAEVANSNNASGTGETEN